MAQLYDAADLSAIPWPETEDGLYAQKFLTPFLQNGVNYYINNLKTKLMVLKVGNTILPLSLNDEDYQNSYVCSPYGAYVTYPRQVFSNANFFLRNGINIGLSSLSHILKATQFNKVVIVNNWFTATNLYPSLDEKTLREVIDFLKKHFKEHTILFRSLDTNINLSNIEILEKNKFAMVASRYVYFTDPKNKEIFETRIFKSDLRFLQKSTYEVVENATFRSEDIAIIVKLYNQIYVEKYSDINPQINENFIRLALENNLFHFIGIKSENKLIGVFGYHQRNGIMVSPIFGYDTSYPDNGIYRLLCTLMTLEAKKNNLVLHQSAGGSFFKKIRKAEPFQEYTAVYNKHLPLRQRLPWSILRPLVNHFGIPYMKKY